jgi:hypothetical protein
MSGLPSQQTDVQFIDRFLVDDKENGAMSSTLQYWRADNMWAAPGRPDGNLGMESITLADGQKRVFVTDWKYEKTRNDGTNFYGSHGRRLTNSGSRPVDVKLTTFNDILPTMLAKLTAAALKLPPNYIRLSPGTTVEIKADIQEVTSPPL